MRISLLQHPIVWADKAANLAYYEREVQGLAGQTDVVVLPEMFTTGFCTDQPELAEPMDGLTVVALKRWAAEYEVALVGSFIAQTQDGKLCNRAFVITPEGGVHCADKRHLFSLGGEHEHFASGNERLLVEYKGVRMAVLICYDLRFPVWSRNVDNAYDVLIYVANFPTKRIADWDVLLAARAIENQCYVCGVNRVGEDGLGIDYVGHSVVLDYKGERIESFADYEAGYRTAKLDIARLSMYREKFPVWVDADEFTVS